MVSPYEEDYITEEEEEEGGYSYPSKDYGTGIHSGPGAAKYQLAALAHLQEVQEEKIRKRWTAVGTIGAGAGKIAYDRYNLAERQIEAGKENWLAKWRDRKNIGPKVWDPDKMDYVPKVEANTPTDMKVEVVEPKGSVNVTGPTEPPTVQEPSGPQITTQYYEDPTGTLDPFQMQQAENAKIEEALRLQNEAADPYKARLKPSGGTESGTEVSIRLQKEKIKRLDNSGAKDAYRQNRKYHQLEKEKQELFKTKSEPTSVGSSDTAINKITDTNYKTWDPKVADYIELPDGSRVPKTIEPIAPKPMNVTTKSAEEYLKGTEMLSGGTKITHKAGTESASALANTSSKGQFINKASKAIGVAGTAYGAYNLAANWDDMDEEDKAMGTASTVASALALTGNPVAAVAAVGLSLLDALDIFD